MKPERWDGDVITLGVCIQANTFALGHHVAYWQHQHTNLPF